MVPASGLVDDFVKAVSVDRCRPVRLLPFDLGADAPSGMWITTEQADYVVYPADASSAERTAIICHELAHMLLRHQPEGGEERLSQMAELVAPGVDPAVARRILARHGYADLVEAEAEHLATLLVTQLARRAETHAMRADAVSDRLR
jgi:hypothetical protein